MLCYVDLMRNGSCDTFVFISSMHRQVRKRPTSGVTQYSALSSSALPHSLEP